MGLANVCASILCCERHCGRVLALPHSHRFAAIQAQSFAISKNMSTQWRKVDGRWRRPKLCSPGTIQLCCQRLASLKIK